jgi:large repetitive protein
MQFRMVVVISMSRIFSIIPYFIFTLLGYVLFIPSLVLADSDVTVRVSGPAGSRSQVIAGGAGEFDVNLPLSKNSVNRISVTAKDAAGRDVVEEIDLTQISFDSLVVAQVKTEPLPVQRIEQLVRDGVIDIDNPENFNVSQFTIVLSIAQEPVQITIPIVMPKTEPQVGYENIRMSVGDGGGGGGGRREREIIVFETVPNIPVAQPPRLPGVIIIDGRIKTLKEFFSVTFMLMNTSGIFTLQDVSAKLTFPDGGLTHTLPADGLASLGVIPPGSDGAPEAAQKEFIIRGDEIGERGVSVEFAGLVAGPGILEGEEVPFSGSAVSSVDVKGPPSFLVQVEHPDEIEFEEVYNLIVDITNTGDTPALYTSLDLDLGPDAELLDCQLDDAGEPFCEVADGPVTRSIGHIFPGQKVRQSYRVNPLTSGRISSCLGIADQNITLQVGVGAIGCLTGTYPPNRHSADGAPSLAVLPSNNMLGVALDAPVVGIFSREMNVSSITTGPGGTFNVYNRAGELQPGSLRFTELNGDTFAIWQLEDGITNRLSPNIEYVVEISSEIRDLEGRRLASNWVSGFTTTGEGIDDITPPEITLSVEAPVNPNNVIPGEQVRVLAYASDQGSGVRSVELRMRNLSEDGSRFTIIDRKNFVLGDRFPFIFTIDSLNLIPGNTYQLLGTAYDGAGNMQDATLGLIVATSADPPQIVLPAGPLEILHGVPLSLTPVQSSSSIFRVRYFLDAATTPLKESGVRPFQLETSTLPIGVGSYVLRAVAEDGLGQTSEAFINLEINENNEIPTVIFNSPHEDQTIVSGQVLNVNATIEDPVGIKSITWTLRCHNDVVVPVTTGQAVFNLSPPPDNPSDPPCLRATGSYTLNVEAVNKLDISSGILSRTFEIIDPPPAPPPLPPVISSVGIPSGGMVAISGTTEPRRRVDIRTGQTGIEVTVYANSAGSFNASISADSGDTLFARAYDLSLQSVSDETSFVVPSPEPITALHVNPESLVFSALNTFQDLSATADLESGGTENVSSKATYSSSNPGVVSVNANGRVVPVSNGTANITVSYAGLNRTVPVEVFVVLPSALEVSPDTIVFNALLASENLSVDLRFNDNSLQSPATGVQFMSGNPNIASVDSTGLVTARGAGSTQITVSRSGVQPFTIPVQVALNDFTPPVVTFTAPADGSTFERGNSVNVSVQGTDDLSGINRFVFLASGAATASVTRDISATTSSSQTFSFQVPMDAPIGGSILVQVRARDAAGNESEFISRQFAVVDETAPTVSVTSPLPGARYNFGDTIPLVVQTSDAVGVTEVRYQLEGSLTGADSQMIAPQPGARTVLFDIPIVPGATEGELSVRVFAKDAAGNEREATTLVLEITNEDITPPETQVTATSDPGSGVITTVTYEVLDGLDDLSHVELYFRRNGIGTFNRYTDPDNGNQEGLYTPQNGAEGTIVFDATKMGGDGSFEFYTVGVDTSGNREAAPVDESDEVVADQIRAIASGMEFVVIDEDVVIEDSDTTYDDQNLRIQGATVTLKGNHSFRNMELLSGAVLTHAPTTVDEEEGLSFEVWSLSIDQNSKIDVSGKGYLGGRRDGNPDFEGRTLGNVPGSTVGSAGSYGGVGGSFSGASNEVYGELDNPIHLGSGGASRSSSIGGNGGGRAMIVALNIANDGIISANGNVATGGLFAGSGSGGSIRVTTTTLSGNGELTANGGLHQVGGGGGRIAVFYIDLSSFDIANVKALGGNVANYKGSNGTIYLKKSSDDNGSLIIDGEEGSDSFTPLEIPTGVIFDNITLRNRARAIVNGQIEVKNTFSIIENSILTHDAALESGLQINAARVIVDATSAIDASGKGYLGGNRPGNEQCQGQTLGGIPGATTDSAASYGGLGKGFGGSSNLLYGSPFNPVHLGSGGPCRSSSIGGNGGGRLEIVATTSIHIDGSVKANGQQSSGGLLAGSGSGGSIKLTTMFIRGSGKIEANGGSGQVSGGGGRVAIFYDFMGGDSENFNNLLNITALSGDGSIYPTSPGTVLLKRADHEFGDMYIDDGRTAEPTRHLTPLTQIGFGFVQAVSEDTLQMDGQVLFMPGSLVDLEINPNLNQNVRYKIISNTENSVTVDIADKSPLNVISNIGDTYAGEYHFDNVYMRRGGGLLLSDRVFVKERLSLSQYSKMSHEQVGYSYFPKLEVVANSIEIDGTSEINVDGKGYLGGKSHGNDSCVGQTNPGLSGPTEGAAGSYGGRGAIFSGGSNQSYGELESPFDFGTGGACRSSSIGGNGGGVINLQSINLVNDGVISANGANSSGGLFAGGGSGGSVLISTQVLEGSGVIKANGGGLQVGGGGGRIAIVHGGNMDFSTSRIEARGGQGSNPSRFGGNGTIFIKSAIESGGDIIIDGYNISTPFDSTEFPLNSTEIANVILRNGARVVVSDPLTLSGRIDLLSGSILSHQGQSESGLQINAENLYIDSTSKIDVGGKGYKGGISGNSDTCQGRTIGGQLGGIPHSGGSYGGSYGGLGGVFGSSIRRATLGDPSDPTYLGSGGSCRSSSVGGNGGGLVRLVVANEVHIDGSVLANGDNASGGLFAGSGSGGSIHISASHIKGSGEIAANGGGNQVGGGGGRIALFFDTFGGDGENFNATLNINSFGGTGNSVSGSAGTVLLKSSSESKGILIIDQGATQMASLETPLSTIGFGEIQEFPDADTLRNDGGLDYLPGSLVGLSIKPNKSDDTTFKIIANSVDTITVDTSSGISLTDVATVGDVYVGQHVFNDLFVRRGAILEISDSLVVTGDMELVDGMLTHGRTTDVFYPYLDLRVEGALSVSENSSIEVSGRGFLGGNSLQNMSCDGMTTKGIVGARPEGSGSAGGSYGGLGATYLSGAPNDIYGDIISPQERGSGGSCRSSSIGGNGGGYVSINSGVLLLQGQIVANGMNASGGLFAGSGSGGGINIIANDISGTGRIKANGGGHQVGGGGGRIAVIANTNTLDVNNIEAKGGVGGTASGEDGTVYIAP